MHRIHIIGTKAGCAISMPAVLLLAAVLSGCAGAQGKVSVLQEEPSGQTPAHVYVCADGNRFVSKQEGSRLWLFLPGKTLALQAQQTTEGVVYGNDGITLSGNGGERAQLRIDGQPKRDSRLDRRQSIWESAKLNGVDFRAVGNEPGWHLEIRNGQSIELVSNYGEDTYRFAAPQPVVDRQSGTSVYHARNASHELTVTLRLGPCRDSMSGERFETSVELQLDGKLLQGCGRALH